VGNDAVATTAKIEFDVILSAAKDIRRRNLTPGSRSFPEFRSAGILRLLSSSYKDLIEKRHIANRL
jgi:hypothetical protein